MAFADLVAAADRAALAHLGGTDVVYQPEVGDAVTVTGMFDESYSLIDPSGAGVEQVGPALWLLLDDLPDDPFNTHPTITIDGRVYSVREAQPDGIGAIRLLLHRADI